MSARKETDKVLSSVGCDEVGGLQSQKVGRPNGWKFSRCQPCTVGQVKVLQVLADHVVYSDIFYLLYKGDIKQEKTRLSSIRYSNMYFNSCIFMFFPEVLFITYITQSVNPESNCFPRSTQGIEVLVGCPVSFSRKCMGRRLPGFQFSSAMQPWESCESLWEMRVIIVPTIVLCWCNWFKT